MVWGNELSLTHLELCLSSRLQKYFLLYTACLTGTKDLLLSDECGSSRKPMLLNLTSVCCKQGVCRNLHLYVPSVVSCMLVSSRCYLRTQASLLVHVYTMMFNFQGFFYGFVIPDLQSTTMTYNQHPCPLSGVPLCSNYCFLIPFSEKQLLLLRSWWSTSFKGTWQCTHVLGMELSGVAFWSLH